MQVMLNLILAVQMLAALAMIGLVLIQHGKGADMGASFGSGSSGSLFGATGSANFLSRSTAVAAALFFCCTLALAYFSNVRVAGPEAGSSVLDRAAASAPAAASAVPVTGAAQIPGGSAASSTPATAAVPAASAPVSAAAAASGASAIPSK